MDDLFETKEAREAVENSIAFRKRMNLLDDAEGRKKRAVEYYLEHNLK